MPGAELLFPLLGAVAAAAVIFAVLYPLFSSDKKTNKRMATITQDRSSKIAAHQAAEATVDRRKQLAATLKELDDSQKKQSKVTLRLRLQRAGLTISPRTFWMLSVVCGVLCAVATLASLGASVFSYVIAAVTGFVGVIGLPRWIMAKLTKSRQQKFLQELANSLDVVVRGVKTGLPLSECLQIVARESPEPIASEFKEIVEQQRVGVPIGEALERMARRVPLPEVRFLTIVMAIQQKTGGNLSEALGNLSDVLRSRIKMKMKVKALSAEATASAAVLASLPPFVMLMVYLTTPDYMVPLYTTTMGNFLIAVGVFWMSCGMFIMRRMINFKY